MSKAKLQLGMNPSTASHRLVKDLLFEYAVQRTETKCFHCGGKMTREDFSVEHMEPWLDSEDPLGKFFDLSNISFSHLMCNQKAARRVRKWPTDEERIKHYREKEKQARRKVPVEIRKRKRRDQYLRTGK